jgi:conjugal transfer pilus assembly protein TrbC
MLRILIGAALILGTAPSAADSHEMINFSQTAIDQAADMNSEPVSIARQTVEKMLSHSQKVMSDLGAHRPVIPKMPNPELFNFTPASPVDIEKLVNQGQSLMGRIDDQSTRYESQILVFVSSSMPVKTVRNYLQQTRKIGAAIVMRGLINDSMVDTRQYLAKTLDKYQPRHTTAKPGPTILIDPTLFSRFDIQQVPTTIVTESQIKPCEANVCPIPVHHKVSGDVSLTWALGLISRQISSEALKQSLRALIKDMEQSS